MTKKHDLVWFEYRPDTFIRFILKQSNFTKNNNRIFKYDNYTIVIPPYGIYRPHECHIHRKAYLYFKWNREGRHVMAAKLIGNTTKDEIDELITRITLISIDT